MLKPKNMCRVECIIEQSKKDAVIKMLHQKSLIQIIPVEDDELYNFNLSRDKIPETSSEISEKLLLIRSFKDILKPYSEYETNFLDEILGVQKNTMSRSPDDGLTSLLGRINVFSEKTGRLINEKYIEFDRLQHIGDNLNMQLNSLEPLKHESINPDDFNKSDFLCLKTGLIDSKVYPALIGLLDERLNSEYVMKISDVVHDKKIILILTLIRNDLELEKTLLSFGFDKITTSMPDKTYAQMYTESSKDLDSNKKPFEQAVNELKNLALNHLSELNAFEEELLIELERQKIVDDFGATQNISFFRFYTPESDYSAVKKLIEKESSSAVVFNVKTDLDIAPVLLDNPFWLKPFEVFTYLFSPPKYGQIDPTLVTAPSFVLFFGFMLGDAFYGLLIILAAYLLKRKYFDVQKVTDFMTIIMWCGFSTIIFGILTGGFFGNFISFWVYGFDNSQLLGWPVLIDPLYGSNSMTLLVIAVLVGAAHVVFGNFLGVWDKLTRKDFRGALCENISWLLIVFAVILYLLAGTFPAALTFSFGFILLLIGKGPMAIMDLPGFLGTVMSYARLLALNLTTPGMAFAFNLLSHMLWGIALIGPLLSVIVFIFAHIIILALNSLGSFVHALRLHYVEYYGTFYGGGGEKFSPFSENRRFTFRR